MVKKTEARSLLLRRLASASAFAFAFVFPPKGLNLEPRRKPHASRRREQGEGSRAVKQAVDAGVAVVVATGKSGLNS